MEEKKLRIPPMEIRLTAADQLRFDNYCGSFGKTKTELAREAVRYWLEHQDKKIVDKRETMLEARMKKMEDRLASIVMRATIDVGVIYQAIYHNYGKEAEKAFPAFYNHTVKRLQSKRKDAGEKAMVTKLVDELYGKDEPPKEPPVNETSS
ncbi:MAG: hypothetical protein ACRDHZ_10550 [Ktedonobacteraceae bacterium]